LSKIIQKLNFTTNSQQQFYKCASLCIHIMNYLPEKSEELVVYLHS